MPSNFVVFCDARTGSYNLVSRLNSCRDIVCHGEIFKKNRIEVSVFHRGKLSVKDPRARDQDPMAFIRELRGFNPARHFGFKLFSGHLAWAPGAIDYLLAHDTLRVLLMRPPLEIYASRLRVQKTGVWIDPTRRDPSTAQAKETVRFTEESFEAFAQTYNKHVAMCRMLAALPRSFVIDYEQTGEQAVMDELLGFLGSKSSFAETSSEYRKQYQGSLQDAFANWDELVTALPRLTPLAEPPAPQPRPAPAGGVAPLSRPRRREEGPLPLAQRSKRVACLTMARDEDVFLAIWHRYYAGLFGAENVFIIDHNSAESSPSRILGRTDLNVFRVPFDDPAEVAEESERSFDSIRFTFISNIMNGLLKYYDTVIFGDADEIYIPDPEKYGDLSSYLSATSHDVIAGIGIDLFHDPSEEDAFDPERSVLNQRRNFVYKFPYSKPHIVSKKCDIGAHGSSLPFRLDPDLYLLHLKHLDWNESLRRQEKLFGYFREGRGSERSLWRFDVREAESRMQEVLALPRRDGFEHHALLADWLGEHPELMIFKASEAPRPGRKNHVQLMGVLPPSRARAAERVRRTLPARFGSLQV